MVTIADEFLKSFKLIGCLLCAYCDILTFIIKKFQNIMSLTFELYIIKLKNLKSGESNGPRSNTK